MRVLITFLSLTLCSCATITFKKTYDLPFSSNYKNAKVEINHKVYDLPDTIKVQRSKENLQVKLILDTATIDYTLRPCPNPRFVMGNLLSFHLIPIAYFVDLTNQKRFYYGPSIYFNKNDTSKVFKPSLLRNYDRYISKVPTKKKGHIDLSLSIPIFNSFHMQPENEAVKSILGYYGLSVGLDYYYKDNKYLSLTAHVIGAFESPLPLIESFDTTGYHESIASTYFSLTHNQSFIRFHIGYGINFSTDVWKRQYYVPEQGEPITRSVSQLG
jgi:hypothetical protein